MALRLAITEDSYLVREGLSKLLHGVPELEWSPCARTHMRCKMRLSGSFLMLCLRTSACRRFASERASASPRDSGKLIRRSAS